MAQDPVIEVRDLVVELKGNRVLNGVTLDVYRGEILGFVGASGAGKSVLTRTILGLLPKQLGRINVFGVNLDEAGEQQRQEIERRWGILFQQGALFSSLTVGENIEFPIREYLDLSDRLMTEIAITKLEMVGLKPDAYRKFPSELSGGMTYIPDQTGDDVGQQLLISELQRLHHVRPLDGRLRRFLLVNILVQVLRKTFCRSGHSRVLGEVVGVYAIEIRQPERPRTALGDSHALHIKAGERSGSEHRIIEQVAIMNSLDRCDRLLCGMCHGGQLALATDPHIAEAVGHRRMDQRDVRFDRRQQHDLIVLAERTIDHFPVGAVFQNVRTDKSAQRHERHALFRGLQRRVQGRAGRIFEFDGPRNDSGRETRSGTKFAETDCTCLQCFDASGTDQKIGLQARCR